MPTSFLLFLFYHDAGFPFDADYLETGGSFIHGFTRNRGYENTLYPVRAGRKLTQP